MSSPIDRTGNVRDPLYRHMDPMERVLLETERIYQDDLELEMKEIQDVVDSHQCTECHLLSQQQSSASESGDERGVSDAFFDDC